ncbi:MAG TPA: ABC transporter ATP-binding protein [Candidatus Pullichristensenella stercoripullorum]|nr:ABC transporter ATP-binding protein [Candidatus Pullichristensenella stercoripullorum]
MKKDVLLNVENLIVQYVTDYGVVEAVNDVSFQVYRGETLGLVGETGAGKTTTALSILRLTSEATGKVISAKIELDGEDLMQKSKKQMRRIRGNKVSMIFQDPMTSLNPVVPIGKQIEEVIRLHHHCSAAEATKMTADILEKVGIPADRYGEYPHQFSGGMKQRVVIAMALVCNPELLIADEPTTALDVTIQAQILSMMRDLKKDFNTSMLLITHDLGVVAETCDRVAIMYAGEIVECGSLADIFENAQHPYTIGLFNSIPSLTKEMDRLEPIPGLMPDPMNLGPYCSFADRCPYATERCRTADPAAMEISEGHMVKCFRIEGTQEVKR